jgi:hypothetical protein
VHVRSISKDKHFLHTSYIHSITANRNNKQGGQEKKTSTRNWEMGKLGFGELERKKKGNLNIETFER